MRTLLGLGEVVRAAAGRRPASMHIEFIRVDYVATVWAPSACSQPSQKLASAEHTIRTMQHSPCSAFFDAARPRWVSDAPHLHCSPRQHGAEDVPAMQSRRTRKEQGEAAAHALAVRAPFA